MREKRIERNNNGRNVQERLGENKDVWVLEARGEGGGVMGVADWGRVVLGSVMVGGC